MLLVEGVEARAETEVDEQRQQRAERREREGALALAASLHREQSLHQIVIGSEGGHRSHDAVEDRDPHDVRVGEHPPPEIRRVEPWPPVDDVELARRPRDAEYGRESAIDLP